MWQVAVCFLETLPLFYLLYKQVGLKLERRIRLLITLCLLAALVVLLVLLDLPAFGRRTVLLLFCAPAFLWTFDCTRKGKRVKVLIWLCGYWLIVTTADHITFMLASLMSGLPLEALLAVLHTRFSLSLVNLLLIAVLTWSAAHIVDSTAEIPWPLSFVLLNFMLVGIVTVEYILIISLTMPNETGTPGLLLILSYILLMLLIAMLVTFECLGIILKRNKALKQQNQLAEIEQQQYELLISANASLAEWKHDYQGQLRLISALIEQERYSELKQFADGLSSELPAVAGLLNSGNRTVDAVVSLRLMDAKRNGIGFTTKLYLPEKCPLSDLALSALVGNILDNAIEACRKLPPDKAEVEFEIKPWKQMLFIHCVNSSDGRYLYGDNTYGNRSLLTTKKSAQHGYGIRRIREIVDEAGGTCDFVPGEARFSVSVMIPMVDER